jgi:hypothetical protein
LPRRVFPSKGGDFHSVLSKFLKIIFVSFLGFLPASEDINCQSGLADSFAISNKTFVSFFETISNLQLTPKANNPTGLILTTDFFPEKISNAGSFSPSTLTEVFLKVYSSMSTIHSEISLKRLLILLDRYLALLFFSFFETPV